MEQVVSITSSSKTTCNGSNRRLAGFIPNKGASNEAMQEELINLLMHSKFCQFSILESPQY
ncbi:hypothetical protein CFSAN001627_17793 [Clostridium botulinum CFSAN001627]|uniref:Uncharacterized protein n=1 Tax=Clostridium botulinum CFSAN001627 TaxID=1232189 RepID=M1ZP77_CLOBO|nr:hypothetical protein CBN_1674 [Clostridium botulinum NCTC 2916]EKN40707.1 hypothetical protein CFSAN001627_17793 [Clostridium botulinum CFSAN001627]